MIVQGSIFVRKGIDGDFEYMIHQKEYQDALIIYMDNVQDSLSQEQKKGGGSAIIRPFNIKNDMTMVPRSVGVPTGWSVCTGGFQYLDISEKKIIDLAFERIKTILIQYSSLKRIIFPGNPEGGIGSDIFTPSQKVKDYINFKLAELKNFDKSTWEKQILKVDDPLELSDFQYYERIQNKHTQITKYESQFTSIMRVHIDREELRQRLMTANKKLKILTQYIPSYQVETVMLRLRG